MIVFGQKENTIEGVIKNIVSSDKFINFLEKNLEKPIENEIKKFLSNKDINEYVKNPEKLFDDLEKEFDVVNIIENILDAITIASIVSTFFTMGGSVLTTITGLGAKTIFRLLLKHGLKEVLNKIVKRIIRRVGPKIILTTGITTVTEYTKRDLIKNIKFLILIESIIPIIETGKYASIEILKQYLINKLTDYNVSQDIINSIKKTNDINLLKNILTSQLKYLNNFFNNKLNIDLDKITNELFGDNLSNIINKEKNRIENRFELLKEKNININDEKEVVNIDNYKIPKTIKEIIKKKSYNDKYLKYIESNMYDFIDIFKDIFLIELVIKNIDYVIKNYDKFEFIIKDIMNVDNIKKYNKEELIPILNKILEKNKNIIIKNLNRILDENIDSKQFEKIAIDFLSYYRIKESVDKYLTDKGII